MRRTKGQVISEQIMAKLAETGSMRVAVDAVLGDGTYERLAGEVYKTLRAEAAHV